MIPTSHLIIIVIISLIITLYYYLLIKQDKSQRIKSNSLEKELNDKYIKAFATMDVVILDNILSSLYLIESNLYQKHILKIIELRTYYITKIEMINKYNLE